MQLSELPQKKKAARQEARARLAATTPELSKFWGWLMLQHLQALPVWRNARTVFCFVNTPTEPDTRPLLEAVLASGRTLCLPRMGPIIGQMDAVKVAGLFALTPGKMGILEPPAALPALPPHQIDLVVAPCLAASPNGARLGHGGGYYDRFLAPLNCTKAVFCPHALLFPSLPAGPHDVPMDLIITEKGVL